MAGENGPARPDIATKPPLPADVRNCNFYVLTEALYRRHGAPGQDIPPRTELARGIVRFSSDASISFPGTDLSALSRGQDGQCILQTQFLGFSGSQSLLPGYYLDQMAQEPTQNEDGLKESLDLFSHRWTQFVYHAWRKYRYYTCFCSGGIGTFSQRMYALVGLGNQSVRDKLAINHSKMLAYAGILATPDRAPGVVYNLASHCFDLPNVTIERWQPRKVVIDSAHQSRLGIRNPKGEMAGRILGRFILGVNSILGARVSDRSGKFPLQIGGLSRERYLSFLPDGENHLPLTMFPSFILRDQFVWDLRLYLVPQQAKGMRLGGSASSRPGRTSFIGQPKVPPAITIRIRE